MTVTIQRSVIIFPNFAGIERVETICQQLDPLFAKIRPHISLVFPFDSDLSTLEIGRHLTARLKTTTEFPLTLSGL
nr:2'-5' RNA ligase family protein [Lapidilactobacillus mulanensis]